MKKSGYFKKVIEDTVEKNYIDIKEPNLVYNI